MLDSGPGRSCGEEREGPVVEIWGTLPLTRCGEEGSPSHNSPYFSMPWNLCSHEPSSHSEHTASGLPLCSILHLLPKRRGVIQASQTCKPMCCATPTIHLPHPSDGLWVSTNNTMAPLPWSSSDHRVCQSQFLGSNIILAIVCAGRTVEERTFFMQLNASQGWALSIA